MKKRMKIKKPQRYKLQGFTDVVVVLTLEFSKHADFKGGRRYFNFSGVIINAIS